MKCPKCEKEMHRLTYGSLCKYYNYYECPHCGDAIATQWQQDEVSRLQGILKEIVEHPDCKYVKRMHGGNYLYYAGLTAGHRCAAAIAAKGVEK